MVRKRWAKRNKPIRKKRQENKSDDASAGVKIKVGRNHNGITRRSGGFIR